MYGKTLSLSIRQNIRNIQLGRKKSSEEKNKISIGNTGKIRSEEVKNQISRKLKGRIISENTKKKMSESKKGIPRIKLECPYCKRLIPAGNYNRWHGSNCKLNKEYIN